MKKITLLLLAFMVFTAQAQAQLFGGKKKLNDHSSEPIYFWFKPVVDVDTLTLEDKKINATQVFLVEAYLADGEAVEVFLEGKTLRYLLQLPAKQDVEVNPTFTGFLFTGKSLGQYSAQSKRSIRRSRRYYDKQKSRIIRERNTEKYELWSEAPVRVNGKLVKNLFLPVEVITEIKSTEKNNVVKPAVDSIKTTAPKPKKERPFGG